VKLGVFVSEDKSTAFKHMAWTQTDESWAHAPQQTEEHLLWHVNVTSNPHEICRRMQSRQACWVSPAWWCWL